MFILCIMQCVMKERYVSVTAILCQRFMRIDHIRMYTYVYVCIRHTSVGVCYMYVGVLVAVMLELGCFSQ